MSVVKDPFFNTGLIQTPWKCIGIFPLILLGFEWGPVTFRICLRLRYHGNRVWYTWRYKFFCSQLPACGICSTLLTVVPKITQCLQDQLILSPFLERMVRLVFFAGVPLCCQIISVRYECPTAFTSNTFFGSPHYLTLNTPFSLDT